MISTTAHQLLLNLDKLKYVRRSTFVIYFSLNSKRNISQLDFYRHENFDAVCSIHPLRAKSYERKLFTGNWPFRIKLLNPCLLYCRWVGMWRVKCFNNLFWNLFARFSSALTRIMHNRILNFRCKPRRKSLHPLSLCVRLAVFVLIWCYYTWYNIEDLLTQLETELFLWDFSLLRTQWNMSWKKCKRGKVEKVYASKSSWYTIFNISKINHNTQCDLSEMWMCNNVTARIQ